jgi:type I restriction enzyme, S subunit
MKIKLRDVFSNVISGEWGDEDYEGNGTSIVRTANFLNDGKVNFANITTRQILKKVSDQNNKEKWTIDTERIQKKRLQNDDIIIEKSGGGAGTPVGRVVYFEAPDDKIYLSNNFTQALRVNQEVAHPKYIFYYLMYLYKNGFTLKYQNQTTGLFNLKLERYFQEEILLSPLDIQLSIITKLDTIQSLIDKRKQTIAVLDKLIDSCYENKFGDPVNNEKIFPLKKLALLTNKAKPITRGIENPGENVTDGVPYIKTSDISNGEIKIKNLSRTSEQISSKYERSVCSTNDLVITIRATIGECAKITKEYDGYNVTRGVAIISPNQQLILSDYLLVTILSKGFKYILDKKMKGATFKQINLNVLKEIKIPIPPMELQNEFSAIKSVIDSLKYYHQRSLDILQSFYRIALQDAFNRAVEIDEKSIFIDLVKKLSVDEIKGNKKRLQYLVDLFKENKFADLYSYSNAREKLFELIGENEIHQFLHNDEIVLKVK